MNQIRVTINGQVRTGWYCRLHGQHALIPSDSKCHVITLTTAGTKHDVVKIIKIPDLSLCTVATGREDKHGVEIYGSMGDMLGGDSVRASWHCDVGYDDEPHKLDGWMDWCDENLLWEFTYGHGSVALCDNRLDELEIISRKEGE